MNRRNLEVSQDTCAVMAKTNLVRPGGSRKVPKIISVKVGGPFPRMSHGKKAHGFPLCTFQDEGVHLMTIAGFLQWLEVCSQGNAFIPSSKLG